MFSSKTPRDLNRDPEPWRTQYGTRYPEGGWSFGERIEFTHDPRPEFDHAQHNAPNPILVARRLLGPGVNIMYADLPRWPTRDEIEHATTVLQRLTRLQTEVTL
jgi:hypothetical protein